MRYLLFLIVALFRVVCNATANYPTNCGIVHYSWQHCSAICIVLSRVWSACCQLEARRIGCRALADWHELGQAASSTPAIWLLSQTLAAVLGYNSATGHFVWLGPYAWYSTTGHSFGTHIINVQKHAQDTSFSRYFLLYWLTVSRERAANIIRRPCSDPSHVTAPYKLSLY